MRFRFRNPFRARPNLQEYADGLERRLREERTRRVQAEGHRERVKVLEEQLAAARETINELRIRNRGLELHHAAAGGTIERVDSEVAVEAAQRLRKMVIDGDAGGAHAHALMDLADMLDATFSDRQAPDRRQ